LALCSADFLNLLAFTLKATPRGLEHDKYEDAYRDDVSDGPVASCFCTERDPTAHSRLRGKKKHAGETVTVCGKVVDTKIPKYGLAGRGKPVTFDLDQPEPKPVFFFVAFGSHEGGPKEAVAAYQGKRVCVTGKIETTAEPAVPFIMAADRSQINPQAEGK